MTGVFGFSKRAEFVLAHCGQPMRWARTNTTWEGLPGQGGQRDTAEYRCEACQASLRLSMWEPDEDHG